MGLLMNTCFLVVFFHCRHVVSLQLRNVSDMQLLKEQVLLRTEKQNRDEQLRLLATAKLKCDDLMSGECCSHYSVHYMCSYSFSGK